MRGAWYRPLAAAGGFILGASGVLVAQLPAESAVAVAPDSLARRFLVDVRSLDTSIVVELRYATANNFTGAILPGYEANRACLRREAAEALARVQRRLRAGGMGLMVLDAYRPVRATRGMVEWARRTGQMHLLREGYISSRSRHNRGLAVDVTLIDFSVGGREVNMGTPYDTFSPEAHFSSATGRTLRYRQLLRRVMQSEGFRPYEEEWWHFEMPGPPLAFDLVIR